MKRVLFALSLLVLSFLSCSYDTLYCSSCFSLAVGLAHLFLLLFLLIFGLCQLLLIIFFSFWSPDSQNSQKNCNLFSIQYYIYMSMQVNIMIILKMQHKQQILSSEHFQNMLYQRHHRTPPGIHRTPPDIHRILSGIRRAPTGSPRTSQDAPRHSQSTLRTSQDTLRHPRHWVY